MVNKIYPNFRDLHDSYPRIKAGMIFRSPELTGTTEEKVNFKRGLDLDFIFDFRCPEELKERPEKSLSRAKYINLPVYDAKKYCHVVVTKKARLKDGFLRGEKVNIVTDEKKECYREMPFAPAFKEVFKAMDERKTFVFHCTEGKDRTGVCSCIILLALGADLKTALNDYVISDKHRPPKNRQNLRKIFVAQELIDCIRYCEGTHEEIIKISYDEVLKRYGTIENYFEKHYGITEERRERWKEFYLEEE